MMLDRELEPSPRLLPCDWLLVSTIGRREGAVKGTNLARIESVKGGRALHGRERSVVGRKEYSPDQQEQREHFAGQPGRSNKETIWDSSADVCGRCL